MSQAKRLIEEQEDHRSWAEGYLKSYDHLSTCLDHGYVLSSGDVIPEDSIEAVRIVVRRGDPDLPKGLSEDELVELLQGTFTDFGEECPGCEKNRRE